MIRWFRDQCRSSGVWAALAAMGATLALLAACEDRARNLSFLQTQGPNPPKATDQAVTPQKSTKLVERDVEAPEVFQVTGSWPVGWTHPSLGGVWVAHPDAKDPERVIIRNSANGKFVIGCPVPARTRNSRGRGIQASSDAAAALGMLAGAPVELNVTALRREEPWQEDPPAVGRSRRRSSGRSTRRR